MKLSSQSPSVAKYRDGAPRRGILKSKKIESWILRGVIAGIFLVPAIVMLQLNSINNKADFILENSDQVENPAFRVRYDDLGKSVVLAWFAERPIPIINLASGIQWPTMDQDKRRNDDEVVAIPTQLDPASVSLISGRRDATPSGVVKTLSYIGTINGQLKRIDILIGVQDGSTSPSLLSSPTLGTPLAIVEDDTDWSLATLYGEEIGSLNERAVLTQLTSWSRAWSSNDSSALKQLSQDSSNRLYLGFDSSYRYVEDSMVVLGFSRPLEREGIIGRIQFEIQPIFVDEDADDEDIEVDPILGEPILQTMDVLIFAERTELPAIVSWGTAGSAPFLEPYRVSVEPGADNRDRGNTRLPTAVTTTTTPVEEEEG